ncbi:MAG TPA: DinB family protein [Aggregatilineales bacterium]|nr:DinB family protein [Aggregatilineales bacterium]
MTTDAQLRQHLVNLLTQRQAHMAFEDAIADFPEEHYNTIPPNMDRSFWHLLEHIRIAQWDILDYIVNPQYEYLNWPDEYWPETGKQADRAAWQQTVEQFLHDRQTLVDLIEDPKTDLYAQIPHGEPGHNILREILVAADHNAYHIGEFAVLRQVMGLWLD